MKGGGNEEQNVTVNMDAKTVSEFGLFGIGPAKYQNRTRSQSDNAFSNGTKQQPLNPTIAV